jgi:hypothetical protein
MAKPPSLVAAALATWNGKALIKGKKDISVFDKSVKSLGRTFGTVFGTAALLSFSKKAIKAFADDEKAAKSLAVQLENTGNAFRVNEVESYIEGLQNLYGVLDDQLRPAFQTLLNATGSVTLSQQALETALNVSAGTGKDLATVVAAIAKGASGTTTSIARLGTGLDKATIATGDMNKIMAALDAKFKGQALARLQTYAGKMDVLKVNAASATEIIGKGLIDALTALGTDNSIQDAADSMNSFALAIADTIKGMGILVGEVKKFAGTDIGKILIGLYAITSLSRKALAAIAVGAVALDIGKSNRSAQSNVGGYSGIPDMRTSQALLKARKEEYNIITKKNAIENKNVEELKKKFDLERIGITAALNSATDEETKLRLRSQLAILDNNEALAKKLLAELEAAEALKKLAEQARLAGMSLEDFGIFKVKTLSNKIDTFIEDFAISAIRELNARIASTLAKYNTATPVLPPTNQSFTSSSGATYTAPQMQAAILDTKELNSRINDFLGGFATGGVQRSSSQSPMDIRVTVDAGGDRLSQAIAESIQVATRSGYSTIPAGFLV